MILTCPNCATRYFVDNSRLGPTGRTVRCAACGERWSARADDAGELVVTSVDEEAEPSSFAAPEPEPRDLPAEELPRVFRERAHLRQRVREAATAGVVWAALAGVFVVVIGAAVVMRQDVARIWPRTAGAYAMIGLPVNLVGLAIEDQHARPALKDGHAAIIVTGSLRNVRDTAVVAPRLRISLLNSAGKALVVKIADPGQPLIPPGEARRFVVDMLDPPVSASDVEVAFVMGDVGRHAAPAPAAPPPAKLSLRGLTAPEPSQPPTPAAATPLNAPDAQPLPASSPYALPAAGADAPHG